MYISYITEFIIFIESQTVDIKDNSKRFTFS